MAAARGRRGGGPGHQGSSGPDGAGRPRPVREIVYLANMALVLAAGEQYWGLHSIGASFVFSWLVLAVAVMALFAAEVYRYRRPGGNLLNLAAGILAIVYVGVMLGFAVQMRMLWDIGALASWIIVVKMGDTGAYAVGHLFGRHKMAPFVSPGKTIEGAFGALLFACLGSWVVFHWLLVPRKGIELVPGWVHTAPAWGWLAFGLCVGTAGMLGDLAESFLKRDVGRKDSSDWLPGFGGVLDILDSLLLSRAGCVVLLGL